MVMVEVMMRRHGESDGNEVGDLWMGREQEVWAKRKCGVQVGAVE
jgi:hypothetical protein